jgi:hypothetical protein
MCFSLLWAECSFCQWCIKRFFCLNYTCSDQNSMECCDWLTSDLKSVKANPYEVPFMMCHYHKHLAVNMCWMTLCVWCESVSWSGSLLNFIMYLTLINSAGYIDRGTDSNWHLVSVKFLRMCTFVKLQLSCMSHSEYLKLSVSANITLAILRVNNVLVFRSWSSYIEQGVGRTLNAMELTGGVEELAVIPSTLSHPMHLKRCLHHLLSIKTCISPIW